MTIWEGEGAMLAATRSHEKRHERRRKRSVETAALGLYEVIARL
jgi:hypothetical protein